MPKRLLFTVFNDVLYDQRMIRICHTLQQTGKYSVMLIGANLYAEKESETQIFEQKRLKIGFKKGKLRYIEYNIRLFFYLLSQPFDAICGVDLDTIVPCFLVAKIRKKPCIYDAHEYFSEVPEVTQRPRIQAFWRSLERWIIPRVKHCYTVSESIANEFKNLYGIDFEVIRNVSFLKTTENKLEKHQPPVILYQGALNEGRGLEYAIAAMQHLEIGKAELWLVGEGDLSTSLRQLAHDLGVSEKVRFLGYRSPSELPNITAQASIGINLLENRGKSYYFSLANKFFDYVQANIPQITMNFPEYERLNQQHTVAYLITPDFSFPSDLAYIFLQLLGNTNGIYDYLKTNTHEAAKEWHWEAEGKKLLSIYEKIIYT